MVIVGQHRVLPYLRERGAVEPALVLAVGAPAHVWQRVELVQARLQLSQAAFRHFPVVSIISQPL